MIRRAVFALFFFGLFCVTHAETTGPEALKPMPLRVHQILQRMESYVAENGAVEEVELESDYILPSDDLDHCLDLIEISSDDIRVIFAGLDLCNKRHHAF